MVANHPKIVVASCSAGGAHMSVSQALTAQLSDQGFEVVVLDAYKDLLPGIDPFSFVEGWDACRAYNDAIQRAGRTGWAWLAVAAIAWVMAAALGPLFSRRIARRLASYSPDLLVSVVPLINGGLAAAAGELDPPIPFVTIVLDLEESAKRVWIEGKNQKIIGFTQEVVRQAIRAGIPSQDVHFARCPLRSGAKTSSSQGENRRRWGLPLDRPVVLVMSGGVGSPRMLMQARTLVNEPKIYTVYVCGRNQTLRRQLESIVPISAGRVLGHVEAPGELYAACDVVVSKPGPMTIWEALSMQRPLVLERGASTLFQERHHARWVISRGLGTGFQLARHLPAAINLALSADWRERYGHAAASADEEHQRAAKCAQILVELLPTPNTPALGQSATR